MGPTRFVGRHRELSLLAGLAEALRAGVGGVVVVDGEQGIGKTALLRAGLGGADRLGCKVLWASADERERLLPLRLMLRCLGSQAGAVVTDDDSMLPTFGTDPVLAGTERLLAAVDRLCAAGPAVLVTEDLQWADDASVLLWERLSRAAGQMPLLLAGSWRQGAARADLHRVRRAVVARGGEALRLGPLPSEDVAALVAGLVRGRPGRRLADLVARAGGNPLYAGELADGLLRDGRVRVDTGVAELVTDQTPPVPVALAAAIAERLAALGEGQERVLRWAAVLGAEFSVRDLEIVSALPAAAVRDVMDSAVAAGVVTRADERTGFRHELIRQVLYDGMPASVRSNLHARAALALASAGAPAEQVAVQLVPGQGEPDAAAIRPPPGWLADWLAESMATLTHRAPHAAAALLRAALGELAEGDARRYALEAALVTVSFLLARHEDTERFGTALLARSADPDRAAQMAWLVGYTMMQTGRFPEAGTIIAGVLARPELPGGQRARLTALHAIISFVLGDQDDATSSAAAALAQARQADDAISAGYALHAISTIAYSHRDLAATIEMIDQALAAIGDDPQATDLRALLLTNKSSALLDLDEPDAAMAAGRQALVLAEHAGTHRIGAARFAVADQHYATGEWDDALAELEVAAGLPGQHYLPAMIHGLIALIAGHRDERDSMTAHLDAVADLLVSPGELPHEWYLWAARAMAAEQAGNLAAAQAALVPCLEPGIAEHMSNRHLLLPILARLAVMAGDTGLTAAAALAARAEADAVPTAMRVALANQCQGLAAGNPQALAGAADYFRSAGRPLDEALAQEEVAALRAGRGDMAGARAALATTLAVYHRLGATWDSRRAEARLTQLGVRVPRARYPARPATGWDALTSTELRVAHLVAQGRSNPDIAAELFLSRSTVQTHVSHILVKLGAHSRSAIVREALRADWQAAGAR